MPEQTVDAYVAAFETEARNFGLTEARDIAVDVRSHINEAVAYGKPLTAVLDALGSPKTLARAYAVELLMQEPKRRGPDIAKLVGLVLLGTVGGIVTLAVVPTLASLWFGFGLSGIAMIVIGALEAAGIHYPNVELAGLSPWMVIALGPVFLALAWAAGWLLSRYVRFAGRQITRTLPKRS